MRPVINSTKHIVQNSLATITGAAKLDLTIASAINVTGVNLVNEVREGSVLKAVFVEEWLRTSDTAPGSFVACLYKTSGGAANFGTANMAALGLADNKKNILYMTQGLVNDQDADATPIMRGWFKIPKSKQRFGLGDELVLTVFAQTLDLQICGFQTYKEYF